MTQSLLKTDPLNPFSKGFSLLPFSPDSRFQRIETGSILGLHSPSHRTIGYDIEHRWKITGNPFEGIGEDSEGKE